MSSSWHVVAKVYQVKKQQKRKYSDLLTLNYDCIQGKIYPRADKN